MKKLYLVLAALVVLNGVSYANTNVAPAMDKDQSVVVDNKAATVEDVKLLNLITTIGTMVNNGQNEEALEKCNKALVEYPKVPDLYYWRASIMTNKGEHLSALADYERAIALAPEDLQYRLMRGMCMHDLGNRSGALDEINYVIDKDPKDGSAYAMRAVVKMEMGDLEGATQDLQLANTLLDEEVKALEQTSK